MPQFSSICASSGQREPLNTLATCPPSRQGLETILVDMAVGEFLLTQKAFGKLNGIDIDAAAVKQVQMGDTNVSYSADSVKSPEQRMDALISPFYEGQEERAAEIQEDGMVDAGAALKRLWTDQCTITIRQERKNQINKQTEFIDAILLADEPCRVSFESIPATSPDNGTAIVSQAVKLFLRSDVDIPPGSTIAITPAGPNRKLCQKWTAGYLSQPSGDHSQNSKRNGHNGKVGKR